MELCVTGRLPTPTRPSQNTVRVVTLAGALLQLGSILHEDVPRHRVDRSCTLQGSHGVGHGLPGHAQHLGEGALCHGDVIRLSTIVSDQQPSRATLDYRMQAIARGRLGEKRDPEGGQPLQSSVEDPAGHRRVYGASSPASGTPPGTGSAVPHTQRAGPPRLHYPRPWGNRRAALPHPAHTGAGAVVGGPNR